jgi:hypothetical protein
MERTEKVAPMPEGEKGAGTYTTAHAHAHAHALFIHYPFKFFSPECIRGDEANDLKKGSREWMPAEAQARGTKTGRGMNPSRGNVREQKQGRTSSLPSRIAIIIQ